MKNGRQHLFNGLWCGTGMAAEGLDDHGGTTGLGDLRDPQGYSGNGNDAGMSPGTQTTLWCGQRGCVLSQTPWRATCRMQTQKPWRLSTIPKKWMLSSSLCLPQRMPRRAGEGTASPYGSIPNAFSLVFPNLSFWNHICHHLQTPCQHRTP